MKSMIAFFSDKEQDRPLGRTQQSPFSDPPEQLSGARQARGERGVTRSPPVHTYTAPWGACERS